MGYEVERGSIAIRRASGPAFARRCRKGQRSMSYPELQGKRVLVVEDELLVSMLVEDLLCDEGCIVVGPFGRVSEALDALESASVDVALLDVNVAGEKVFPVALMLEQRGVPFLFVTGYGEIGLPPGHPTWEACSKPFRPAELTRRLASRLAVT
jgi:DNA-binding response OmpR family regulator